MKPKVAALASLVFIIQCLAWPLGPGRDAYSYFYYLYDWGNKNPADWFTMMFRTPLAPLFNVFLIDGLGPLFAEIFMGMVFVSVMVLFFKAVNDTWGKKVSWIFVSLLLLHFSYGSMFHVVSNDPAVTIVFALLMAATLNATKKKDALAFAILGTVAGLMLMARPGIFGWVGIVAFLLVGVSRKKCLTLFTVYVLALAPWVLGWSYHNYKTYGTFQFSIGTEVFVPLGRALAVDHLVKRENGPATEELSQILEQTVLKEEKFKGWDVNRFYQEGIQYIPLMEIVGREKYKLLSRVGWEGVRSDPLKYTSGVAFTLGHTLLGDLKLPVPLTNHAFVYTHKNFVAFQKEGADHTASLLDIDPYSLKEDPVSRDNFNKRGEAMKKAYETISQLPERNGNILVGKILNLLTYLFPPMLLWICFGFFLFIRNRDLFKAAEVRGIVVLWLLAVLTNVAASLGIWTAIYQYRIPFDPIYILVPVVFVFASKRPLWQ